MSQGLGAAAGATRLHGESAPRGQGQRVLGWELTQEVVDAEAAQCRGHMADGETQVPHGQGTPSRLAGACQLALVLDAVEQDIRHLRRKPAKALGACLPGRGSAVCGPGEAPSGACLRPCSLGPGEPAPNAARWQKGRLGQLGPVASRAGLRGHRWGASWGGGGG